MKHLLLVLAFSISAVAFATIDGPSCGDLTDAQEGYIEDAAKKYYAETYPEYATTDFYHADCHDYDGVHSATEFGVEWNDIQEIDGEMMNVECSMILSVEVEYNPADDAKFIEKDSVYTVTTDEYSISCSPR